MARSGRTVHRGGRSLGQTAQELRSQPALRAAATRLRLKALVTVHGVRPEIVQAGWQLVKGRKLDTREAFFAMHEAKTREEARQYQDILLRAFRLQDEEPDWMTWVWSWY